MKAGPGKKPPKPKSTPGLILQKSQVGGGAWWELTGGKGSKEHFVGAIGRFKRG